MFSYGRLVFPVALLYILGAVVKNGKAGINMLLLPG